MNNKLNVASTLRKLLLGAGVALMALAAPAQATGLIILEGSDAQTFHRLDPYSTNFQTGLQKFSSDNTLPVLVVGDNSPVGSAPAGKDFLSAIPDLATLLSKYSGIYITSPGTCCGENDSAVSSAAAQAALLGFSAAGRSIGIENYQGGAAYDFLIHTGGAGNAHTAGFGGGVTGLGGCFDGNFLTAAGAAFGLGPVAGPLPNISCFGHQGYEATFFDALGFTAHLADNPGLNGFNVVVSNGGGGLIEATGVPEPTTLALLSVALLGLGMGRRKNVK